MPDERSRFLSLAPQFGSFAVVVALAATLIPAAKNAAPSIVPVPPPVEAVAVQQDSFATFLVDARLADDPKGPLSDSLADNVLIATLPDPAGTDFGYWFDQCVESLSRAMADGDGYGLERYWHAWMSAKPDAIRNPENIGVLVYRKNDKPTRRRVVLIVRENALEGVRRDTFLEALKKLPFKPGLPRVVKILGPSFSGSLPSILESIKQWDDRATADVRLISGSAIGIGTEASLPPDTDPGAATLTIRSTHAHITVQMNAMLHYLAHPGNTRPDDDFMPKADRDPSLDLNQVAFLIESNSGFGAAAFALRRIRNGVETIDHQLWDANDIRQKWLLYGIAVLAGLAFALPSYFNAHRSWDGRFWDAIFLAGFSTLAAFAAVSAFRFIMLWRHVKLILRGIAGVPMVGAFDRLPERTSAMLARFLLVGRRRFSDLAVPYRLLAELRPSTTGECRTAIDHALELNPAAGGDPDIPGVQASKLSAAARELVRALMPMWSRKNVVEAYGSQPLGRDEAPQGPQALAEQFIAVQAVFFVSQYFTQLRYFAYMGTFAAGCLLFALTEYHFEPEHLVMVSGAGLVAAVVGVVAWGLVEINKNELVSRVTRTTPGRLSLDSAPLVMNAVQLAGPLVLLLLVQLSGRMRSVVEPAINLFR